MDISKIRKKNNVPDQMRALNQQDEIYRILNKTLAQERKQKIEKEHKQAISSGMRVYHKGDKILNRYQVFFSKSGGMGKVYLCYDLDSRIPVAVKTILPIFFRKPQAIEAFKNEALVWVNLEKHKNIVTAFYISPVDNLPAIFMEMIGGNKDYGNDLSDYIGKYKFNTEETLKLAVQFCDGMIYAEEKFKEMGKIFVHRDIKPNNIMITKDMIPKITDFGLVKSELEDRTWGGTPGYMSPEQFKGKGVDVKADIYSFTCVLYEIFCNGRRPYELTNEDFENIPPNDLGIALQKKHLEKEVIDPTPFISENKLKNDIKSMIIRGLEKDRDKRFRDFNEFRECLERLYSNLTGKRILIVDGKKLEAYELSNKGESLRYLGKYEDAIESLNKALEIDPGLAEAFNNKAIVFSDLGKHKEAIDFYDSALKIKPEYADAWFNKGSTLVEINLHEEGIECYNKALEIKSEFREALTNKGVALIKLKRFEEGVKCYDKALKMYPDYYIAWNNKGNILGQLGRNEEAIECFLKALNINQDYFEAWYNLGNLLKDLG